MLEYHAGSNRELSKAQLEVARRDQEGRFTLAKAYDRKAGHWAYPDQVLADCGYEVEFYGDTGGGAFAVTKCGLQLWGNGWARAADVEAKRQELAAYIGKRLF